MAHQTAWIVVAARPRFCQVVSGVWLDRHDLLGPSRIRIYGPFARKRDADKWGRAALGDGMNWQSHRVEPAKAPETPISPGLPVSSTPGDPREGPP